MIIGPNRYDNYELLAPREEELQKPVRPLGGMPGTDAGYCHRFMFYAPTKDELLAKIKRFFGMMTAIPGYSTLRMKQSEYPGLGRNSFCFDVVYTIETPFTGVR